MHYLEMLSFISKRWINLKHAFVSIIALSAVTTYEFSIIISDLPLLLLGILMFVFMFLFGTRVRESLVEKFPLPEHERQKVVNVYPPQRYSDMAVFHIVIVLAALTPILIEYFHVSIRQN